jgi:[acyl-carrier-protein] S-malonyltransferase
MGRALVEAYPEARAVFEEADEVLGYALSRLCFEGPAEELTLTANAQPAILATSIAALRVLERHTTLRPDVVGGHSLGEYSALVAAGALTLKDAVRMVHLRGKFMQEAVPVGTGAMAAVLALAAEDIRAACQEAQDAVGGVVSPANFNSSTQIVIAGAKAAVEHAMAGCKRRGAKRAVLLPVSAPFHCALMQPAADRLAEELNQIEFVAPAIPVVTNVEATPCRDPRRLKDLLVKQVTAPVRWEESVRAMAGMGVTRATEVGAGTVLSGLCRSIVPDWQLSRAGDPESINALAETYTVGKEAAHAG